MTRSVQSFTVRRLPLSVPLPRGLYTLPDELEKCLLLSKTSMEGLYHSRLNRGDFASSVCRLLASVLDLKAYTVTVDRYIRLQSNFNK
jgi:hypothetical protein